MDIMHLHTLQAKADDLWSELAETRRVRRRYGRTNPPRETALESDIASVEREMLGIRATQAEGQAACGSLFLNIHKGITRESLLAYAAGCRERMLKPFF